MKPLCFSVFVFLALPADALFAGDAAKADAPAEWQKIESIAVREGAPRTMLSPGLFDPELFNVIAFTKEGAAVDTGLPHAGKDKAGKERPAILARFFQGALWLDFNGDGKPGKDETRVIISDGWTEGYTDPFACELHYEDGTAAQYVFRLKTIVENQKFAIVRAMARVLHFQGQKIVLLDDNGNGKYGEAGKDSIAIGDSPVSFVGKHVSIGDKFYELLVHEAGVAVEIRPVGKLEFGWVDMFEKYKPPQKSENLKIHTLIVSGPQGSFGMDERVKKVRVPVGAYDIVFGLFERAKETVYLKKGEKTSFLVAPDKTVAPVWGGKIKARFDVKTDEKVIVAGIPAFKGEGTERYFPENFRVVPVAAGISQVMRDAMNLEHKTPFGSRRYEVLPNGEIAPVTFKPYRSTADEYEISVDYNSGIMGSINGRQRHQYVPVKKKK